MTKAAFISDLHLHPNQPDIQQRFLLFIEWALQRVESVYILGDFLHIWPGDDALDDWSCEITSQLARLHQHGISVYFIHGNRDFLIGTAFAKQAKIQLLPDPSVITLGNFRVLITHGDQYCTRDKSHQWLRRLTRNTLFPKLFLLLPLATRKRIVYGVREHSKNNRRKSSEILDTVEAVMMKQMRTYQTNILIHGHTHKPGLSFMRYNNDIFRCYVLSDWDDKVPILCYDNSNRFYFDLFLE